MNWQAMLPLIGDFFSHHPYLGITFAGFIAFIESLAIVGSIIPGSIMMGIVGFLLGIGVLPLKATLISIFIGAFLGDMISYALGAWYQDHFKNHDWVKPYHHWVSHGESFMKEYGAFSIIIGRFFGPMRSIIPLIAGLANMHLARFTLAIIPTIILWAIVYLAPGVLLGALSVDMGESYFTYILSNLFLYTILLTFWYFLHPLIRLCVPLYEKYITLSSEHMTHAIKAILLLCLAMLFGYYQVSHPPETNWVNIAAYHYSLIQSTPFTIEISQIISLASGHIVFILMNLAACLVLYHHNHKRFTLIWAGTSSSLFFLTWLIKYSLHVARPNPLLGDTSFPSGHIVLFITFVLCLSIILENSSLLFAMLLRRIAFVFIAIIAASRLILQAHWLLDLLASAALALSIWHTLSIFRHRLPVIPIPHLRQIGSAILLIIIPYTAIYQQLPSDIRPSIPKPLMINHTRELDKIPRVRYSRFGHPVAPLNFIFVGSPDDLENFFVSEGFEAYPGNGHQFLSRIKTLIHYSEYHDVLPILPPIFERRGPDVIYGKQDESHAFIAKLWHLQGKTSVYVGTVSFEQYPEGLLSPSILLCQKYRFNIGSIFDKRGRVKKTAPINVTQSKNAFCWNGEILIID